MSVRLSFSCQSCQVFRRVLIYIYIYILEGNGYFNTAWNSNNNLICHLSNISQKLASDQFWLLFSISYSSFFNGFIFNQVIHNIIPNLFFILLNLYWTRMHSSRMHTVCCSGCWGVYLWGGGWVSDWRVSPRGEVSAQRGVSQHALGRGCLAQCILWYTPPRRTEFLTHACENITFPQLFLRTVIKCLLFQNIPDVRNFRTSCSQIIFIGILSKLLCFQVNAHRKRIANNNINFILPF